MGDTRLFPRSRLVIATLIATIALVGGTAAVAAAGAEWNVTQAGGPERAPGVTIAVVDTGVDAGHPAFGDRVLPQIDVVGGGSGDGNGHGTHVAGTAAGAALDCGGGASAIGIAPDATILPVRVLDDEGAGTVSGVAEGIRAAADRGAAVVNLSLGPELNLGDLSGTSEELVSAIEYAWSRGSIPVLAAGNGSLLGGIFGSGYGDLPAVVVTAVDRQGDKPGYATAVGSARWGIAAPGGAGTGDPGQSVLSAWPGQHCAYLSGTSMAAPHVSGALAVLRARGLSPREAVDRLLATARSKAPRSTFGAGVLDLAAAVDGLPAPVVSGPSSSAPVTAAPPPATAAPAPTAAPTTAVPTTDPPAPSSTDPGETATSAPPSTTTSPRIAGAPPEFAADLRVRGDASGGEAGTALRAGAGLACAAAWLLLGRAAWARTDST